MCIRDRIWILCYLQPILNLSGKYQTYGVNRLHLYSNYFCFNEAYFESYYESMNLIMKLIATKKTGSIINCLQNPFLQMQ